MAKNCNRCGKRAGLEGSEHCGSCLCDVLERRVKRSMAGTSPTKRLAVACAKKRSLNCVAASHLMKNALRHAKLRFITLSNAKRLARTEKTALTAKCSDDVAANFLKSFIRGSIGRKESNVTNVLESVTEKELELYAGIKRLKYVKAKKDSFKQGIQAMQSRYPGTVEALAQAGRKISELMKR